MLDAATLKDLVTKGTGRKNYAPWVGLGSYELCLTKIRMKRDKGQAVLIDGKVRDIPGRVLSYIIEGRVERSNNPKNPVGSDVACYMEMSSDPRFEEKCNKDAFEFCQAFYSSLGESLIVGADGTDAQREQAIKNINGLLGDPLTGEFDEHAVRGVRLLLVTRLPKATDKDGNPKKKIPTEEGILYKNWSPITQTVDEMLKRRAELDKAA